MELWNLFVGTCVSMLALCAIIPIVQAVARSAKEARKEREAEARRAAQEEARRQEKARKDAQQAEEKAAREAEKAEKRRAADAKKAEQKRKADERAAAILAREQEKARKREEELSAARQLAEYQERALQAEKELQALRRANIPAHPQPAPAPQEKPAAPAAVSLSQFARAHARKTFFAGEHVAFTGQVPNMTREECINAVETLGGHAYTNMPSITTILVVGNKPGKNKLDKAEKWAGVRKMTADEFRAIA